MIVMNKTERTIFVLQKPARRIVVIGLKKYFLSMPSILYRVNGVAYDRLLPARRKAAGKGKLIFNQFSVYFANDKLKGFYALPLPNTSPAGFVCLGLVKEKVFNSLEEMAESIIEVFWTKRFDTSGIRNPISKDFDLKSWHENTKKDPNWVPSLRGLRRVALKVPTKKSSK